jgi:hypothetical protein
MNDETDSTPASGLSTEDIPESVDVDEEDFDDEPTTDLTADYPATGNRNGDAPDARGGLADADDDALETRDGVLDADSGALDTRDGALDADGGALDSDRGVLDPDGEALGSDGDVLAADGDVPGAGGEYLPDARGDIANAGQNAPDAREYPPAAGNGDSAADSGTHGGLLEGAELQNMIMRWKDIQSEFVDEPGRAVEEADALVGELMQQLSAMFASERAELEQRWAGGNRISTEELRQGLRRYRVFFERLLAA